MRLGKLKLENNLILAPMQNVTTGPYRRFCRKNCKIGLVCVPMLYSNGITRNPDSIAFDLHKIEEERPISVQLIGSDIESLKGSIEILESYKFDVLDINAGCPSKRAIKSNQGGYLLKDFEKLEDLLTKAVKFSSKPVSLKTRIGFTQHLNLEEFKKIINDSGIEFLTVHARKVKDRFNESALDLEFLKRLKKAISVPLIGNGNITDPKFAKEFIDYTKVDALMIGRGSIGNPEIFHQIHRYLSEGKEIRVKNNLESMINYIKIYENLIDGFLDEVRLNYPIEEFKFIEMKRNSIWLTKKIDEATDLRRKISETKNLSQLNGVLHNIFDG